MGGEEQSAFLEGVPFWRTQNHCWQQEVFPSPPDPLLPRNSEQAWLGWTALSSEFMGRGGAR